MLIEVVGLHLRAPDELTDTSSARSSGVAVLRLLYLGVSHD